MGAQILRLTSLYFLALASQKRLNTTLPEFEMQELASQKVTSSYLLMRIQSCLTSFCGASTKLWQALLVLAARWIPIIGLLKLWSRSICNCGECSGNWRIWHRE